MSETPRTDKHVADIGADGLADGDFARGLERENDKLRAILREVKLAFLGYPMSMRAWSPSALLREINDAINDSREPIKRELHD